MPTALQCPNLEDMPFSEGFAYCTNCDLVRARHFVAVCELRVIVRMCRYRAALQSEQTRSRSLAVALQAKQRLQGHPRQLGQQLCSSPLSQLQQEQYSSNPLKSALKTQQQQWQTMSSPATADAFNARPMTAFSVLQSKLGVKPSILQRPSSAHTRLNHAMVQLVTNVCMLTPRCVGLADNQQQSALTVMV